jgi:predicted Rossmann-fold nucleotide-binding protein
MLPWARRLRRVRIEIKSLDELRAHREAGHDLRGALLTGLDLTFPEDDRLLRTALDGAVLLGCTLSPGTARRAEAAGALLFPVIPELPYRVYRTSLYTPEELFEGFDPSYPQSYVDTVDARIYLHSRARGRQPDPLYALAERLHDHAITEALVGLLSHNGSPPIAVMGGHALTRDSAAYRAAVELGMTIGRSRTEFTVLTGGGPGAMEAVPLGVRLSGESISTVDNTLRELATAPRFGSGKALDAEQIGRWLAASLRVELPPAEVPRTIGIPTWFYGHEPPNRFCTLHAKYFANSVREDGLLTVATGGVVYTPGSAGTVQEVFQDYTQNHYASMGPPAPMVFLGKGFWTEEVPAATLVRQLARGREVEPWILVTDEPAEAVELLERYAVDHAV